MRSNAASGKWAIGLFVRAFFALLFVAFALASPAFSQVTGWTPRADYPAVIEDDSLRLDRLRMQVMTRGEDPLARLERVAHDYVYGDDSAIRGYDDPRLRRRMKADGFSLVESFQDKDGTAAMVLRDDRSGKYTIAFRGTDDQVIENIANLGETVRDKPVGFAQYNSHSTVWNRWASKYGANGKLTVTGHSRGGGLAALFTASHADKVEELAMFQAPGQMLADHKLFRESVKDWPKATLVVAASDAVQLAGARHIGQPKVILGLANDMGISRIGGHTNFIMQSPWITDWRDNPYRNPGDGLLRAVVDYGPYAATRIWASPNAMRAQTELDAWLDWMGIVPAVKGATTLGEGIALLDNAKTAYNTLKQEILRQNRPQLQGDHESDMRPSPDLFDHLLPPEFHGFEPQFYRFLQARVVKDYEELGNGTRNRSGLILDENTRSFLRDHSVAAYLVGLRNAYEGDMNSLRTILGMKHGSGTYVPGSNAGELFKAMDKFEEGSDAVPDYAFRVLLVKQYYQLQKQSLLMLDSMFAAGQALIEAQVVEGANELSAIFSEVEKYLLDAETRKQVNATAKKPLKPGSRSAPAVAAGLRTKGINWQPLSRAYEIIHEDLFVGAISFEYYMNQVAALRGTADVLWEKARQAASKDDDPQSILEVNRQNEAYDQEIAHIDASFATQAESKLARLSLLVERYNTADIEALLTRLTAELAQARTDMAAISDKSSGWFDVDGEPRGIGEAFLAAQAPSARSGQTMSWLSDVGRRGDNVAAESLALSNRLADIISEAVPQVEREQDYILGVIDHYVFEAQSKANIIRFAGSPFPAGSQLRRKAYEKWITPLGDVIDDLLALRVRLNENGRVSQDYARIADERSREIAFFGSAFQSLLDEERSLAGKYSRNAEAMHPGSSNAARTSGPLPSSTDYSGPLITFNNQSLCIPRYACDYQFSTQDYLERIGERLRIWRLPSGDTKSSQDHSEKALAEFWAFIPEHNALAAQFPSVVQEVKAKVDVITPIHTEYLHLVSWRRQLETSFKTELAAKPVLNRSLKGTKPLTRWSGNSPQSRGSSQTSGVLPVSYALTADTSKAWRELNFDFGMLSGRLDYLQNSFLPQATKLIADIAGVEAGLRREVDWRVAEIINITEEIRSNPTMPISERNQKLELANRYVNYALGVNSEVYSYAPFRADFATDAQKAYQALTKISQPAARTGTVQGLVSDGSTGIPLSGATVRIDKVVSSGLGPSASIVSDREGRFLIDGLATGWWTISITSTGYEPFSQRIRVNSFDAGSITATLAPQAATGAASVEVVLDRQFGTSNTNVQIRITDRVGNLVARGTGPHNLAPGDYIVNSYAQYLETDPSSAHIRLVAGQRKTITVTVWRDDEEEDEVDVIESPTVRDDFAFSVVDLCASNADFVRSLYHTVPEREPAEWEINTHVKRLQDGVLRSSVVTQFLLAKDNGGKDFMTDAIQAIYGRQPTASERASFPRMRRHAIVADLLESPEHIRQTQLCTRQWRETATPTMGRVEGSAASGQPLTKKAAEQATLNAYNKLTGLMAAGKGNTPEAQAAYQAYQKAKKDYEAVLGGETVIATQDADEPNRAGETSETRSVLPSGQPANSGPQEISIAPAADVDVYAYSYQNWNMSNWGKWTTFGAGWHPTGGEKRAFLRFAFEGIDLSTVKSAKLRLYHYHSAGNGQVPLGVFRVTQQWNEGRGLYKPASPALPGEVTWMNQPQYDLRTIATFEPGTVAGKWIEVDITQLVREWASGVTNHGLVIASLNRPDSSIAQSQYSFVSRENSNTERHPKLVLEM